MSRLPRQASGAGEPLHANRTVVVLDTAEEYLKISRLLGGLGFNVVALKECEHPADCTVALVNPECDPDLEACRALSASCKVLLTTNEREFGFKIRAVHNGAQGLLSRPLMAVDVFSSLEETRESDVADARILIIDDDELTASVYAMALEECALRVAVIANPLQAEAAIAEFRPDLVIMDIDMPEANGLDVAKAIRLDPAHTSLPILFLSSINRKDVQEEARAVGGDDFIRKPVDIGYLVKLVRMRAARAVELRQIMVRDGLTGLLNHVSFKEKLTSELNRSARTRDPFTVALLDLDHFKSVNDSHGHQAGDSVIQTFATLLKSSLRNIDVIGRYGGEEFAVLLLGADPAQAETTMDRIREEFERIEFAAGEETFHVTFSCGLAGSGEATGGEALLTLADTALYEAKAGGRNRIRRHAARRKAVSEN
ncbi:GGDEF domain-containing protein [Roseibium sp. Sym1]|uniref:GGDEF domain-containing protein n=1 Tax=Roseibium sp. Sym1 TaxID=3016006 RepID=UPI0022B3B29C|nr:diguanylate cyclase [Roseibium sp. Sym1]